ncbi:MAG: NAD(P)H-dependent oxidoreductase [Gammaproteobacteria bacterium]|nr:NAD(P)H-dependent oxidoreductase [Gammaproteobacteria bacterium]
MTRKILAFAASNSRQSINKKLVTHAAAVLKAEINSDVNVEILDLNDFEMPIYSIDRETENGIPGLAQDFLNKIAAADAMLISYAEHNGNYAAAYKNIFDWASRIETKVFQDKPMVIMSASPGKGGGANSLRLANDSAPHFRADVRASFSVGSFASVFDAETGALTDRDLSATLRRSLKALF